MVRVTTSNYGADPTTQFAWATTDGDFFDREDDLYNLAQAVENHTHESGRGLPVARVAANSVDTNAIQALAVTNPKLAIGAAVANIGYTPLNKAGDTVDGNLTVVGNIFGLTLNATNNANVGGNAIVTGTVVAGAHVQAGGNITTPTGTVESSVVNGTSDVRISGTSVKSRSIHTGTQAPATISPQGAGSGLNADTVDNLHANQITPTGAVVWFRTSAELSAAGAGWTEETSLQGRIPYGAGTTHGQTFTANTDTGSNWTPVTGLTAGTVGPSTDPDSGATAGGLNLEPLNHTHPGPTINGQGSAWFPPGRVGVFGRKT